MDAPNDLRRYPRRPILLDAAEAHREAIRYAPDGTVTIRSAEVARQTGQDVVVVPPERQYPAIRATLDDLNKAISSRANSPRMEGGLSLRQVYDIEAERYEALTAAAMAEGRMEPDYGTYVFDAARCELYLVAPERWHRLALVTSNSKLMADPEGVLSWAEVRARLESAVVGFAGVSVGGNILEGWLREARPRRVKVADPDWVELTNLNRGERMSLRHVVASRAQRFDPANPYDVPRVPKAEYIAYESQLVDPYLEIDVYADGLTRENIERFLLGGDGEPRLDVLVEEMDNMDLKVLVRQVAREHGIDVLMLSDFGHQAHVFWNPFRDVPDGPLGYGADDETLLAALAASKTGDRSKVFEFVGALCGPDYADDEFAAWIAGRGEQPTSSLPQSGATAMASGAIGGKELALRVLGHPLPPGNRAVYDLRRRRVTG
ncbi:MAG: ThiF family adenylyltransferase [Pseudomonadota bacterium]|nr:ThiF family adenylyltransferase [Pseudomonadota bacterium]